MRNNNPDIIIHELIERKAKKGLKINLSDSKEVQEINEMTVHERKLQRFNQKQAIIEREGEFVEVKKGLSIFIKAGEDKEKKIFQFLKKLKNAQKLY